MSEPTLDDIRGEFPDWTVYRGTDRRWHARPSSATPPVQIVHDDDLTGIREEILRKVSQIEEAAYRQSR